MERVEVYRTNISSTDQAEKLKKQILRKFSGVKIHVDLNDCDKILRIVSKKEINIDDIQNIAKTFDINVSELEE